jgi:hypothetical protein
MKFDRVTLPVARSLQETSNQVNRIHTAVFALNLRRHALDEIASWSTGANLPLANETAQGNEVLSQCLPVVV